MRPLINLKRNNKFKKILILSNASLSLFNMKLYVWSK